MWHRRCEPSVIKITPKSHSETHSSGTPILMSLLGDQYADILHEFRPKIQVRKLHLELHSVGSMMADRGEAEEG